MTTKFFKLTLCLLLSLSMTLLFGCNRMRDTGMTDDMITPPDTETMPTLKVGLIHPQPNYTGFGKGAELARGEINAVGGILGMQVEFIYKEETTETVVESATELAEVENVVAILGPLFSSHAVKVGPVINIPVLLGATRAEVTETGDFLFLVAGSNVLQAELLAQVVVNQLDAKTAAMIWLNGDVYSEGFVKAFDASFEKLGGSVVEKQIYEGSDITFDMQLAAIKAKNPDVLLLASFPPANPLIMKQARDMGIESVFIGSDGMDDPLMYEILEDNTPLDNTFFCTNLDPDAAEFISAYEAMFGLADGIAASGYDAMKILAYAIETTGSTDPVTIRDTIAAITNYEGATSISHFDENRNPVKSVGVRQILNGQPQPNIIVATPEVSDAE